MLQHKDFVALDMPQLVQLARDNPQFADDIADRRLCDYVRGAMQEKLALSRVKGRGGWWDASQCSTDSLKQLLCDHLSKGDMVDVINIAGMIYAREAADGGLGGQANPAQALTAAG
mgnify:CR=1 FL=1